MGHETFNFKDGVRAGEGDLIVYDREIIADSYIRLSNRPGLGLDPNKDVVSKYLMEGEKWWGWEPPLIPGRAPCLPATITSDGIVALMVVDPYC
jgi:hypothetical protein